MKRTRDDRRTVAVALWLNGMAGRDILTGIFCYARAKRHAAIRILPTPADFSPEGVARLVREGVDGVIADYLSEDQIRAILKARLPLVIVGPGAPAANPSARLVHVDCDNARIGELGARHLAESGKYRSYGFVGAWDGVDWSEVREAGFRRTLRETGEPVSSFHAKSRVPGAALDPRELEDWLMRLDKPTAVMAAYDAYALQVLDACQRLKLAVPGQVSVLGVDNDDLLCDFAAPPLSSVRPDHERAGYLAAERLDVLMNAPRQKRTESHVIDVKTLVERDSTGAASPAGRLVQQALAYIRDNVHAPIRARDVVAHPKVSRRLADLRFRELQGTSIGEAILNAKLDGVARQLRETTLPLADIAARYGFPRLCRLQAQFKRKYGVIPSDYRLG